MSYIKKRQQINQDHEELALEEYDEKHVFVRLTKSDTKDYWNDMFSDLNAIWKKKGWIVNKSQLDKLKVIMYSNTDSSEDTDDMEDDYKEGKHKKAKHSESESGHSECDCSECEDDSDSTDDELVQKALSRRLMSESTQKEIELENVEDSELEDVVSVCRRFRFLYREIKSLRQRISELERKI